MTPLRIDRPGVLRRMGGEADAWVIDGLLDAFEPAAVAAIHLNAKQKADAPAPTSED